MGDFTRSAIHNRVSRSCQSSENWSLTPSEKVTGTTPIYTDWDVRLSSQSRKRKILFEYSVRRKPDEVFHGRSCYFQTTKDCSTLQISHCYVLLQQCNSHYNTAVICLILANLESVPKFPRPSQGWEGWESRMKKDAKLTIQVLKFFLKRKLFEMAPVLNSPDN
jgi:hypothetical protein